MRKNIYSLCLVLTLNMCWIRKGEGWSCCRADYRSLNITLQHNIKVLQNAFSKTSIVLNHLKHIYLFIYLFIFKSSLALKSLCWVSGKHCIVQSVSVSWQECLSLCKASTFVFVVSAPLSVYPQMEQKGGFIN